MKAASLSVVIALAEDNSYPMAKKSGASRVDLFRRLVHIASERVST